MSTFHFNVSMDRRPQNEWLYTVKLAAGITDAHIGRAVSMGVAANTVKLAADGEAILGRLEVVEDNGIGTVALKFVEQLPIKAGETVVLGGTVVGAGSGEVKPRPTANDLNDNIVVEVRSGFAVVFKK